jgi:hypothetical protein
MVSSTMALLAVLARIQAQTCEQQCNDGSGEHFKETFHPQMHQPPAPVFDHRIMRMRTPGQRGCIKTAYTQRCQNYHGNQARLSDGFFKAGNKPRPSKVTQNSKPMNNRICQTRPMLVNSKP